ncbi:MAG: FAD-dependent oxidoreductase [Anaerococcus sp.]|nr:FAD-dependent oxidoreductase [Anaerococcus sp.]
MYDIIVIGAGVTGASIARRLSRYKLNILILEKEIDVSMGASKANSAIVHGGYAESHEELRGRICYKGRVEFNKLNQELNFGFLENGSLVLAFNEDDKKELEKLYKMGLENDLDDIEIKINQYIEEYLPENAKAEDFSKREEKYGLITEKNTLLNKIDSVFFYNYYQRNKYNLENLNIKELNFKMIILNYGKSLEFAIINNKNKEIVRILDRLLEDSIKYSLVNDYKTKAITQFNYYLSLKKYYEKKEENYMDFQENMKRKLESAGDISLEGDEEIFFAVGQVLRKLLNYSNIGDKNLTFIRNFLGGQKTSRIIENLEHLLVTYAHNISAKDVRLNRAVSQILVHKFDNKKAEDRWIIAGFLEESYLYGKKLSEGEENDRA